MRLLKRLLARYAGGEIRQRLGLHDHDAVMLSAGHGEAIVPASALDTLRRCGCLDGATVTDMGGAIYHVTWNNDEQETGP